MPVWTGLGADNNWSTVLNWGIDGSGNTGVPTTGTSAFFTGVAPNGNKPCTITSGATCLNLDFTGYTAGIAPNTAVITFTNSLTVRGSITLSAAMGDFAGANGIILIPTASSSYTSNGKFFDKPLSTNLNTSIPVMTFIDNWRISSFTTTSVGGNSLNFVGVGIVVQVTGNFTINQNIQSTNTFRLTGAGSTMSSGAFFAGNINIDVGVGTLNITNFNFVFSGAGSLKWTSGTINHTGTITIQQSNITLDLQNTVFNNLVLGFGTTTTLLSDANFNNVTLGTVSSGSNCVVNGVGWRLKCRGNLTLQQNLGNVTGTGIVSCTGAGTITSNCSLLSNFEVNSSGTYTLLSSMSFGGSGKSVVFTGGALNTGTTTTTFISGTTISTLGVNWFNVTIPSGATITINQLLSITGGLLLLGSAIFTGTEGWTTGNFTHGGFGTTCTLQSGNTYRVNGLFTMIGTALSRATLQSSDAQNVTVSIPALSDQMTLVTGTIPAPAAGYVLGSRAFTSALPAVLSNLLPDRPTILSGPIGSVYTLTEPINVTNVPSSLLLQVGKKAIFRVTNNGTSSTNVLYAQTRDIDSDGGITILAGQSYSDALGQPSANLFRTLNWGPLVAPSGSVYYTFIN